MAEVIGTKTVNENGEVFYSAGCSDDGLIYKNITAFDFSDRYPEDEIVYILEYGFPEESDKKNISADLVVGFTRNKLIALTGSTIAADLMFEMLTWQYPETLWIDLCGDSDANGHCIEATMAYEKVYVPDFDKCVDGVGQEPVCYKEFFEREWKDKRIRQEMLDTLRKMGCITYDSVEKAMKDFEEEKELEM